MPFLDCVRPLGPIGFGARSAVTFRLNQIDRRPTRTTTTTTTTSACHSEEGRARELDLAGVEENYISLLAFGLSILHSPHCTLHTAHTPFFMLPPRFSC